jgi:two-component system, sensor histidine kinase and response regulator
MRLGRGDRPARILLVDDRLSSVGLINELLRPQGYEVTIATSSHVALHQIEQVEPDLVLLDVGMPEMDGYAVCYQMHQNPALAQMPILLLTDDGDVDRGLAAGALDVIPRSIAPTDLLARIETILRLKQQFEQRHGNCRQHEAAIADIVHDVKMPLVAANQLLAGIQAGAFGAMSAELRAALAQLATSNQTLLHLVELRLSIHQYEIGGMELSLFPVDLVELSRSVIEELQPLAVHKGLELGLVNAPDGLPEVMGDRLELRRLLNNLLNNAIHFTDVGSVQVSITASTDSAANQWLAVAISDTGIGIVNEEQESLFERFRQGRHRREGHGLGLYLCRQIAEAHQGRIEVRSVLGQGSCFTVYLPVTIAESA